MQNNRFNRAGFTLLVPTTIGVVAVLLFSCRTTKEGPSSALRSEQDLSRHEELGRIVIRSASSATPNQQDFVYLGAAVKAEHGQCVFLSPDPANKSTPWPPVQTVWGVYANAAMQTLPATYEGLDGLKASEVKGQPVGFKYLSFLNKQLVSVGEPSISPARDQMAFSIRLPTRTVFVVEPDNSLKKVSEQRNIVINLQARTEWGASGCISEVTYCLEGSDCTQDGPSRSLSVIDIQMSSGFIPSMQSVVIR